MKQVYAVRDAAVEATAAEAERSHRAEVNNVWADAADMHTAEEAAAAEAAAAAATAADL
jgi:hypothetical protein